MPELPDVVVYVEALQRHIVGRRLERLRLLSPFVLRTVVSGTGLGDGPTRDLSPVAGQTIRAIRRVGKRILLCFDSDLFLVIHLMIAGRLRWREPGKKPGMGGRMLLAAFDFPNGTLYLTEASSQKRASIQLVRGESALAALDPGGVEPLSASLEQFRAALARESHTLKRALTDPHLFSGIGNAYSDEILHAARLSPLKLTRSLSNGESARLYDATRATLLVWIDHLRREVKDGFPENVTAFRDGMAVHGRFKQPCPACGAPVQRIRRGQTPTSRRSKGSDPGECNYCAKCQTNGRLLVDRSLSRLLKGDWPRTLDE